jgi:RimJ/RimL family protein N-acetyltransferase
MLKTERIILAPLTQEDSHLMFLWINDHESVSLNSYYMPVHEKSHLQWFDKIQQQTDVIIFGIRRREDNQLIGYCQLRDIHPIHHNAELRIRLGEKGTRNKGYGTDAVRLLVEFGFDNLNLHRIYLTVLANNSAAIHVYEKIGFIREGLLRQAAYIDGIYNDVVLMAILQKS